MGAMIVAGPDGFMKSQYRKFNIRGDELTPGDDFGMMKEVLTRRFKRLLKEDPDREPGTWPDLLLIDGGAGQVSAVAEIMARTWASRTSPMVGVAKGIDRDAGKEEFHRTGQRPFALRHNDPVLYFVQRLRDEAHRFAIGTHRAKRAKAVGATPLDDVPGVGAARKRALLAHFGSAKAVSRADLADLKAVDGISDALAETIYDFFHHDCRRCPAAPRAKFLLRSSGPRHRRVPVLRPGLREWTPGCARLSAWPTRVESDVCSRFTGRQREDHHGKNRDRREAGRARGDEGRRARRGRPRPRARSASATRRCGLNYIDVYHRSGLYKLRMPHALAWRPRASSRPWAKASRTSRPATAPPMPRTRPAPIPRRG